MNLFGSFSFRFCSLNPAMQKKIQKCDFSYFIAIAAPYAPVIKFRIMCDWGNWVGKQNLYGNLLADFRGYN